MLEELTNFLIVKNCYRKFQSNLQNSRGLNIKDFCDKYLPNELLDRCFSWDETPEGGEFWSSLNAEWMTLQSKNHSKNGRRPKIM